MPGVWSLVEDGHGLEEALRDGEGEHQGAGQRYLCTSPTVFYELKRHGKSVESLHRFLSFAGQNRLCEALELPVARLCRSLDVELHRSVPGLPGAFRPFDAMEFQLKSAFESFAVRYHQLESFFGSERPSVLHSRLSEPRSFDEPIVSSLDHSAQPLIWAATESSAAVTLLQQEGWPEAEANAIQALGAAGTALGQGVASTTPERVLGAFANLNLVLGVLMLGLRNVKARQGSDVVTVISKTDEVVAFLMQVLTKRDVTVDWWTRLEIDPVSMRRGRPVRISQTPVSAEMREWKPDTVRTIVGRAWGEAEPGLADPLTAVLRSRLIRYAGRRVPVLLKCFERSVAYLEKRKPHAVLSGTRAGDAAQVLAQACQAASTPLVSFQHGGNIGYNRVERLRRSDLKGGGLYATYGPGVTGHLESVALESSLDVKPVTVGWERQGRAGSYRFGRRRLTSRRERPDGSRSSGQLVLYVAAGVIGDRRLGVGLWYDDVDYFSYQTELLRVLSASEFQRVVIKRHMKEKLPNPLARYVADAELRAEIIKEGSLSKLLPQASTIVVDFPSTTLVEALAMGKRVIYVDLGLVEWLPEAVEKLKLSARWISKRGEWQAELAQALEDAVGGSWHREPDIFCREYAAADYTPTAVLAALGTE